MEETHQLSTEYDGGSLPNSCSDYPDISDGVVSLAFRDEYLNDVTITMVVLS